MMTSRSKARRIAKALTLSLLLVLWSCDPVLTPDSKITSQEQRDTSPVKPDRYGRVLVMESTAYTHTGNRTATGTWPQQGRTVAVDPEVIPLGSQLIINGVGGYVAEDTGGAVKGAIIDIHLDSHAECMNWGRRTVEVRVVG